MPRTKKISKIIIVDFPDMYSASILGPRWHQTARLLNLEFINESVLFGDNQCHTKLTIKGLKADVDRFCKFVNESSQLGDMAIH